MFLLYLVNWTLEAVTGAVFRAVLFLPCGLLVLVAVAVEHHEVARWWWPYVVVGVPLWGPPLASLAGLVFGGGGLVTRWRLGARSPSPRERERVVAALEQIGWGGRLRCYVVDAPTENALTVGTTVYLERGLIWSEYLSAVLAHELHHATGWHGRFVLALGRLRLPLGRVGMAAAAADQVATSVVAFQGEQERVGIIRRLFSYAAGGWVTWFLSPLWARFWRRAEFDADRAAFLAGQGRALAEYLERLQALDRARPGIRPRPYVEERLAYLERL
jgi:Zn-dependent protease with chaperone function